MEETLLKGFVFEQKVLSEPWRLSTSQTANRGEYMDTRKHPKMITGGGGFGPVTDDGYGCAYSVIGEDEMFFHVSSKHSSNKTVSPINECVRLECSSSRSNTQLKAPFVASYSNCPHFGGR